jgi:hypothetical protein
MTLTINNSIYDKSEVIKMAETHTYTFRFTEQEFAAISRIAEEQGIPIARVIRLGLLYLYAHLGDKQAFDNLGDVSLMFKDKVMEDVMKTPDGEFRLRRP